MEMHLDVSMCLCLFLWVCTNLRTFFLKILILVEGAVFSPQSEVRNARDVDFSPIILEIIVSKNTATAKLHKSIIWNVRDCCTSENCVLLEWIPRKVVNLVRFHFNIPK
jgi:hypothetical protein